MSNTYLLQEHSITFGGKAGIGVRFAIEPWSTDEDAKACASTCGHFVQAASELHAAASALSHLACSAIDSPEVASETHRHLLIAVQVLSGLGHALSAEAAHRLQQRCSVQVIATDLAGQSATTVSTADLIDHREAMQRLIEFYGSEGAAARACGLDRETARRVLSKQVVCKPETLAKVRKAASTLTGEAA